MLTAHGPVPVGRDKTPKTSQAIPPRAAYFDSFVSITTFSYYKSPIDYSKSIALLVEASMLSSSRDSPGTLSSILSGEGLYEMEHEGSRLTFPIFRFQIAMPEMARYPKRNGKGSAETLPGG
jgi:hypothetical protein